MVTESSVSRHLELSVRDFGPIAEANIDLRPMTVFVGPSNTGKSYLAILIYALHGFFAGRVTVSLPSPGTELGDYAVPLFNRGTPSELTISPVRILTRFSGGQRKHSPCSGQKPYRRISLLQCLNQSPA